MRFARHLAAVLLVVAVIAAVGMVWAHGDAPRYPTGLRRFAERGQEPGLSLSDLPDLIRTVVVQACVIAVVVTFSAVRRRRRRTRRRTVRSAEGS